MALAAIGSPQAQVRPIVIAHRGASGERPEHTLAAYDRAIDAGADFIEPDLVLTRDDVFVARHENDITDTTDISTRPAFADRRTTKVIDGQSHTGWFAEDFTLAELKTLRAKERLPELRPESAAFDGRFEVPTLAEVIALAKQRSTETGRTIGIYPETKHPSYFASIGKPMEKRLVEQLHAAGWDSADAPVFIQSFEVNNLKALRGITRLRLVQLMVGAGAPADNAVPGYATMLTPQGLRAIASYADGIGPEKRLTVADDGQPTGLVAAAHAAGLLVHPWTIRAENVFLPLRDRDGTDPRARGRLRDEMQRQIAAGVDGFFTDFPYDGVAARDAALDAGKK
ncbi:MAG TPA: glycerophosphodiester phosphodiesterase [Sphingomonas sp.]|nr:glycerophosphodiester phosphodiesterase [Sphingomonas sp.]HTG37189.1 glycerophosphodiester phosphodiesterase [Sphingomonas sp.]